MPARVMTLKPVSVNVTVYSPGRRSTILYWPFPSVMALLVLSIRAGLAASTVTPGSAPPVTSLTTPAIALCAEADPAISTTADTTSMAVMTLRRWFSILINLLALLLSWMVGSGHRSSAVRSLNGSGARYHPPTTRLHGFASPIARSWANRTAASSARTRLCVTSTISMSRGSAIRRSVFPIRAFRVPLGATGARTEGGECAARYCGAQPGNETVPRRSFYRNVTRSSGTATSGWFEIATRRYRRGSRGLTDDALGRWLGGTASRLSAHLNAESLPIESYRLSLPMLTNDHTSRLTSESWWQRDRMLTLCDERDPLLRKPLSG